MKNIKKVFAVLAACAISASMLSFAACDNTNPDNPDNPNPPVVTPTEVSVTVNPTTKSIEAEQTFDVTATVTNSDKNPTWASSNPAVATVSGTGKTVTVTAVAEGTANVTATVDGKTATCAVTVTAKPVVNPPAPEELTLAEKYVLLAPEGTGSITAENIGDGVTFTSSDTEVVTVTSNAGVATVTGVKYGTATITAVSGDTTKTCLVEVATPGLKYTADTEDGENYYAVVSDGETKATGELRIPGYYYDADYAEDWIPVTKIASRGFVDQQWNETYSVYDIVATNRITSVYTGDNVVNIGDNAFSKCTALKTLNCAVNLEVIGGGAFDECEGLDTINWAEGGHLNTIGACSFRFIAATEFVVPASVTTFHYGVFQGATKLQTVKFDAEITIIYNDTFLNCTGLKTVYLPGTVVEIQQMAFGFYAGFSADVAKLDVYFGGSQDDWNAISINETLNEKILLSKNNQLTVHYNADYYNTAE